MTFQKEADFEEALIKVLADKGWEKEVIKNPTEQDLIRNWAKILFDNNRGIDRLNNYLLRMAKCSRSSNRSRNLEHR